MRALLTKIGAIALIAALLAGGGYYKGRQAGRVAALKDTVAAYQKRENIDNETGNLDTVDLCIELGGLPNECEQLRGLEETATGE